MNIKVRCRAPKYVAGEHCFSSLEELYYWLSSIRGLPKHGVSTIIYFVAKEGFDNSKYRRLDAEITADFHNYSLAEKLAKNAGLLMKKGLAYELKPNREKALAFAKALDSAIKRKGEMSGEVKE